ncbi:MAG: ATP-binding cassette domain-containing protein [Thermoguttaceae bacterium]|jgi:osmoprotectant transport system ATP-binding protein|nr:ATP-binding cassette domain-containing protein [Thermoguttaceae bacterium]
MIVFDAVTKTFPGGLTAVDRLSLEVAEGETLVLLGASGSGKTTSMKMINRLIEPSGGRILVGGDDVMQTDPTALRRRIGYAIQHIGLFPHMTVGQNIAVVPRMLRWDEQRVRDRTDELLGMVGLDAGEFRERYPRQLSGGQSQRIGVARALAADPPILLMDEPFGALDPITREQLQGEFLELESVIRKTVVLVTHDVFEAVRMADRIALLDRGRLVQLATPAELVEKPANGFVEEFLGRQRFQLSLLTRTVGSILPDTSGEPSEQRRAEGPRLRARDSLVSALDLFKSTGERELPVFRRDRFVGMLTKRELLDAMTEILGAS